jgi:hypothetical protein
MIDSVTTEPESKNDQREPSAEGNERPAESLVQRVERLEDAVATLQDTHLMEDRIVERVSERFGIKQDATTSTVAAPDSTPAERVPVENMVTAERHTAPAFNADPLSHGGDLAPPSVPSVVSDSGKAPWLLVDVYNEFRTMLRMYVDFRYRVSWSARVLPMVLVSAILLSWLWVPGVAFLPTMIGTVLDKTVDLILAFFLYKVLSREVRRYREALAKLPPVLQRF